MRAPATERARLVLRLGLAVLLMLASASLFGIVAEDVVSGDRITLLDVAIARWLRDWASPQVTAWMLVVTHLHSTTAIAVYSAVVGAFMARLRRWRSLATVVVCVGGGLALNVLLKHAFQRTRPLLDDPLLTLQTYSFPSGHVVGSTLFYGLGVVLVFRRTPRLQWRLLALSGAAAAIGLVAFTRLYLGVHYLSDVVAGFLEGVAWLALCLGLLEALWRSRDRRHDASLAMPR